jgi:hypothetical protein
VISFTPIHTHTQAAEPGTSVSGATLQAQIEREYKIRDGASRLLQASKNSRQSMEASKSLFVSNAKIIAIMKEMQQRQSGVTDKKTRLVSELEMLIENLLFRVHELDFIGD